MRAYIGTCEILDDRLTVREINVYSDKYDESTERFLMHNIIHQVFSDSTQVHATWFTGALVILNCKMVGRLMN